ncbi:Zinc finger C2H2-type [Cinara cedri]|uniref:Zinc finger C2H2-type n=1 Tax=Cinara cedri TaxID=506608 RepID=A0A5E4MCZ2_9HEMI|nr:Zinc finger C2H2-type [Cinara cedri]
MFTENYMNGLLNEAIRNDPALCPNGCGRSYKGIHRKGILKHHLIYTCGVNPQFKCIICKKQFRHNHMNQLVNEASKYDPAICLNHCGQSNKSIQHKDHLKYHLIYVYGVTPQFKCTICQKQLRQRQNLNYHMAIAHSLLPIE